MSCKTKKGIVVTVAWLSFLLMLGVVFGVEKGWSELRAMWWCLPCLLVWAGGLYKAGWMKW